MTRKELLHQVVTKKSFLCVGLDTDIKKIPEFFLEFSDPVFEFNKQIIDGTKDYCVGYKINSAFYEAMGEQGWKSLYKTAHYIPSKLFKIADVKRGDIGNTCEMYAKAFFKTMNFDAVTLSPYMGEDSIKPFLEYKGKWVIVLALTSNESSKDLQFLKVGKDYLFEKVTEKIVKWGTPDNTMLVVGATHPEMFKRIREIAPHHFLLVPGIGEQGGELSKISKLGLNQQGGLLVAASRSIIYAGNAKSDYRIKATKSAYQYQREMEMILKRQLIVK